MTTAEQRDALAAGIARIINQKYFINDWEAGMLAQAFGFCSGAQIMEQQKILRANPQAVARWVQVMPQDVNPYLLP
jgi:hypothetical protein